MTETIEAQLRAAMTEGSEHLTVPDGAAQRAWAFGLGARMERDAARPRSVVRLAQGRRWMRNLAESRLRLATVGVALTVVAVLVAAFALGGAGSNHKLSRQADNARLTPTTAQRLAQRANGLGAPTGGTKRIKTVHVPAPSVARGPILAPSSNGSATTSGSTNGSASAPSGAASRDNSLSTPTVAGSAGLDSQVGDSSVTATRVVKTGSLSLTVKKGQVASTITTLTQTTTSLGGYVSQSRSNDVDGSPEGSLTLRIPVSRFEEAVTDATKLGKETSLVTNAHDVTGKFVDLGARLKALKRTRSTYLTILARATTIGETLSVQGRVNDIQQKIESLEGQLKVLRNQSADGTLTVDVAEAGSPIATAPKHHHRSGWSKAWHNSTSRFNRGIQAIIGGLGPLLLALILLAVLFIVVRVGMRATKRA